MRTVPLVRAALASCASTALIVTATATAAAAAPPVMTLSSIGGPSGGGNTITGTVAATATNPGPFPAGASPTVQFQYVGGKSTACSTSAKAVAAIAGEGTTTTAGVLTVDPDLVKRISQTKIGFQVPAASYPATVDGQASTVNPSGLVLIGNQTTAKWNICVYDSDSTSTSTLLATAPYTLAVRPLISAVLPASSPVSGGQAITVTGVGFSAAGNSTTASIGGASLTNVRVAANGKSFTAVTAARSAGANLTLTVNTPGGPVISSDPDNNGKEADGDPLTADTPIYFEYSNGVTVTPDTAPPGSRVNISVRGVGFQQLTFKDTAAATDATAHVFLVKDAYDPATNRGVQECKQVLVVNDTELICTLDLKGDRFNPDGTSASGPVPEGSYTVTVVASGATTAGDAAKATIVSSGSTFTVSPF
ncbi:IPT/TIG domain-containing protein [Actinoplanes sp. M2I2]|uniref:IPT/TIG domain-containing protein n=1 Tax=Actinoplanes sp. M2I2 TaxID=1734444 RepID=UPI00202196D1|nr:IPT/TIG domain-containing protein [Actinoplanes sp. M2I2]